MQLTAKRTIVPLALALLLFGQTAIQAADKLDGRSELFNVTSIQSAGYPVVVYTVDDATRTRAQRVCQVRRGCLARASPEWIPRPLL